LRSVAEINLRLDLKLHPREEDRYFDLFTKLIQQMGVDNVNIAYGLPGEMLLQKYDLFILDFLPSALVPFILSRNAPVICWLDNYAEITKAYRLDLSERCYFVSNKAGLDRLLNEYVHGFLPSKWSETFVDQYLYPVAEGNPGPNIASYLAKRSLSG
jgi:hypothetical protein